MRFSVVWTASRNIAARIEGRGCPPSTVSRIARNTKNAAREVGSLVTTKLFMKFVRSLWRLAIHPVPMPPEGSVAGTPNEGNQLMSPGRVMNTIAQNIHLAKLPPITAAGPPSRRRLMPPRIRHNTSAEGASSIIALMKSRRSCGVAIRFKLQGRRATPGEEHVGAPAKERLRNATGALLYPELQKPSQAG